MPNVLVTGAGVRGGIAAACARTLAQAGWDVGLTSVEEPSALAQELRSFGGQAAGVAADLADPAAPATIFETLERSLGPFTALVAAHSVDVELPLLATPAGELDRHFAVNARAVALLVRELAERLPGDDGRVVAFTSDALVGNVPYGVSKGALDRIVLAAALELGRRGIRANCVNPGPTETGWITDDLRAELAAQTPLGRTGLPRDAANLVAFLLSPEGGWITGQVLHSDGGLSASTHA